MPRDARDKDRRERNKVYIANVLRARGCADCGERDPVVLEFDHDDPAQKRETVPRLANNMASLARLDEEISRCTVRCANCHRRRTAAQFAWPSRRVH